MVCAGGTVYGVTGFRSGGNMCFNQGTTRTICVNTATSGANIGGGLTLRGGVGGATSNATAGNGGYSILNGGTGGADSVAGNGGCGGRAIVRGGTGGASSMGTPGAGGSVEICGGTGSGSANGGHVYICGGYSGTAGCVMLYNGSTKRLNTTTTGTYTTGIHCSTSCSRSPVHCSTTAFRSTGSGY